MKSNLPVIFQVKVVAKNILLGPLGTQHQVFFFLIEIHSMQGWTATTRHGVARKRNTKRLRHAGNLFRKNL